MKKSNLEFKVGLFVLAALVLLGVLVFKAGDFYLKPGYTLRLVFSSIGGVDTGSPIRLAGVNVGEVKEIHVMRSAQGQTQVEVLAWIAQGAVIEEDARPRVNSLGLLGEKYIEIFPGSLGAKTLSDGATLVGTMPVAFDDITDSGSRLIDKMETTLDNVNELVTDDRFKADIRTSFSNISKLSASLMDLTADLKDSVKSAQIVMARLRDGEGSMGRLLKDDKIAKDLEAFVSDIRAHPWKLLKRN